MSSTDDEARAGAIFDKEVVPLPKVVAAPRGASFYHAVAPTQKSDFELRVGSAAEEVRALLQKEWRNFPALQPLAEALAQFSATLPSTAEDASAELSPFIYVMF